MLFRYPFVAMGSGCEFLIHGENQREVVSFVQSALTVVKRLEKKYSYFQDDSLLSVINREARRREFELDEETAWLLGLAGELHQATDGRYDPTVGALKGCWDFREMKLPRTKHLCRTLKGVGWHLVEHNGRSLRFHHPDTRIDLGGLVKEYAVDCAVGVLRAMGVQRGLVNLGGDLRVVGKTAIGTRPFYTGVAHPRRHHDTVCSMALREGALVTSGDYQRYFLRDGRRYHHLLDPTTGYPFDLPHSGVTAHAATAVEAMKACKILLLGKTEPAELRAAMPSAYITCDLEGNPVAWKETPACSFRIQGDGGVSQAG